MIFSTIKDYISGINNVIDKNYNCNQLSSLGFITHMSYQTETFVSVNLHFMAFWKFCISYFNIMLFKFTVINNYQRREEGKYKKINIWNSFPEILCLELNVLIQVVYMYIQTIGKCDKTLLHSRWESVLHFRNLLFYFAWERYILVYMFLISLIYILSLKKMLFCKNYI